MSPFHSSYYDSIPEDDFELLQYLSVLVIPFAMKLAKNQEHIRKKLECSTSWCHLAARAVAEVFEDKGLRVADGRLYDIELSDGEPTLRYTEHSWCVTKNGTVLDVAPVGVVSFTPIMLSKREGVAAKEWGFVTDRYCESTIDFRIIRGHLRSPKFKNAYPVYVSLLKSSRKSADARIEESKKARARK